uniref:Vacuolar protein sorting-associated protein 72 homolog n=1 Tax=Saimiri boliviensis boliviensis TaxID=39432 RepID=A0A2K6UQ81_SAIBB
MSLAGGRAPRKTAGNRLSGLLEAEEEDEFYQTTYGGFTEARSGPGEREGRRRRGALEEPVASVPLPFKIMSPRLGMVAYACNPNTLRGTMGRSPESMRQSTAEHTRQTFLRVQERQGQSRRRKGPHCERPLTQEELLREAKITEELNLRSLGQSVVSEKVGRGAEGTSRGQGGLDPAPSVSALTPHAGTGPVNSPARCSRTFITFSDDATFEEWFPQGRPPKVPVREVCPVTHRPALYRDPVTDIPYATARAFKIIREAYKKYITAHGLPPTASALGPGPPPPEPLPGSGPRALRQKIIIK